MTPEDREKLVRRMSGAIVDALNEVIVEVQKTERFECGKLARAWAMKLDNVVAALKAGRAGADGGDMHDALKLAADRIATEIEARGIL